MIEDFHGNTSVDRMNFGFGVGDILTVATLARDVYKAYKDAPSDFKNISDEIKSLHIILDSDNLKARLQDPNLNRNPEEPKKLQEILQGCTNVLEDLDKLLIKYKSLGSLQESSKALDRVKWGQEAVAELRARLTSNTTLLNTFVTKYVHPSTPVFVMDNRSSPITKHIIFHLSLIL